MRAKGLRPIAINDELIDTLYHSGRPDFKGLQP